jgi:hypothetical protein
MIDFSGKSVTATARKAGIERITVLQANSPAAGWRSFGNDDSSLEPSPLNQEKGR